jgi:uncharacterized damage-inducible protein DinB
MTTNLISTDQLAAMFRRNLDIVKQQIASLSEADSLLQLPFRGNCLNWVLGHLAENRNSLLRNLGRPEFLAKEQQQRYGHGSAPVTCAGEEALPMSELLGMLERSQPEIEASLRAITPKDLSKEVKFATRTMTLGERLFFQYFHETYHVGQTEILRQLAGTDDKII